MSESFNGKIEKVKIRETTSEQKVTAFIKAIRELPHANIGDGPEDEFYVKVAEKLTAEDVLKFKRLIEDSEIKF